MSRKDVLCVSERFYHFFSYWPLEERNEYVTQTSLEPAEEEESRMEDIEEKLEEMLKCSVCQDILEDPRQLPCGHSVCLGCLDNLMAHSADIPFRCPDCRGYFGPFIGVHKSYTLTNIAENYKVHRKKRASVFCDICPISQTLAIKTCLKCEVSLCKEHVKDHTELPVFMGHPLVSPLGDPQARKCPKHANEVLKYYCDASKRYICNVCALENKQHKLVTETSTLLRRQLTEHMDQHFETLEERITDTDESVKKLQRDLQNGNPTKSVNPVSMVLLCMWFIVLYYAYNFSTENQTLKGSLEKQQDRVHQIYSSIAELMVDHPMKKPPATKDEGVLLDADTASPFLGVSVDFRTAERVKTKLDYPSSKSRFDEAPQVLSARCVSTGLHAWLVKAEGYWDIAVSYRSIQRKSKSSAFGKNAHSWSLTHNGKGKLFAYHDGEKTVLSKPLNSTDIAVMVDFGKGNITFMSVDSSLTRLHEFRAKLTQPVCLGLGLYRVDPPSRATVLKTVTNT